MNWLQGVLGHAFQFQMNPDGGFHMHDNLDWSIALEVVPEVARFRTFEASKLDPDPDVDLPILKRQARDAVVASLERGVPPLVWQPQTIEMREAGNAAACWGLIVGYNEADETYTVRHPFVPETFTVRYDVFSQTDPYEWFHIKIWEGDAVADVKAIHEMALRNAVAFAHGTRFTDEHFVLPDGRQARPYGFAAYDTWLEAFDSPEIPAQESAQHAHTLRYRRQAAAEYVRGLTDVFPTAAGALEAAASHYERESSATVLLAELCEGAAQRKGFTAEERTEAQQLVRGALAADLEAVAHLEEALSLLEEK